MYEGRIIAKQFDFHLVRTKRFTLLRWWINFAGKMACRFSNRTIFNWVSKSIRNCIFFALLHSEIDPQNPRHFLNRSENLIQSRLGFGLGVFPLIGQFGFPFKFSLSYSRYFPFFSLAVVNTLAWFYDTQYKSVLTHRICWGSYLGSP